jgi:3-methyl-2-oxobutanoate hydroxymethyltransferase
MADEISKAAGLYAADVRSRAFPTADQTYQPKN